MPCGRRCVSVPGDSVFATSQNRLFHHSSLCAVRTNCHLILGLVLDQRGFVAGPCFHRTVKCSQHGHSEYRWLFENSASLWRIPGVIDSALQWLSFFSSCCFHWILWPYQCILMSAENEFEWLKWKTENKTTLWSGGNNCQTTFIFGYFEHRGVRQARLTKPCIPPGSSLLLGR